MKKKIKNIRAYDNDKAKISIRTRELIKISPNTAV